MRSPCSCASPVPALSGDRFDLGLKALTEMSTALRSHTAWHLSPEDARLCLYSALLLPLARAECREAPNKSKTIPLSRYISNFNIHKGCYQR